MFLNDERRAITRKIDAAAERKKSSGGAGIWLTLDYFCESFSDDSALLWFSS